jgi:hypothetical protein
MVEVLVTVVVVAMVILTSVLIGVLIERTMKCMNRYRNPHIGPDTGNPGVGLFTALLADDAQGRAPCHGEAGRAPD